MHFGSSSATSSWLHEAARIRTYTGHEFARVWSDSAARDSFAKRMAADLLDLDLTLRDRPAGATLGTLRSAAPARGPDATVAVEKDGAPLGSVDVCWKLARSSSPLHVAIPFFVFAVVLWGASGRLARRLARPYTELARVAREIQGRAD